MPSPSERIEGDPEIRNEGEYQGTDKKDNDTCLRQELRAFSARSENKRESYNP